MDIIQGSVIFQPFVLETLGGFGPKALDIIKGIGRNLGFKRGWPSHKACQYIRHRLSAVLARCNADMLLRAIS